MNWGFGMSDPKASIANLAAYMFSIRKLSRFKGTTNWNDFSANAVCRNETNGQRLAGRCCRYGAKWLAEHFGRRSRYASVSCLATRRLFTMSLRLYLQNVTNVRETLAEKRPSTSQGGGPNKKQKLALEDNDWDDDLESLPTRWLPSRKTFYSKPGRYMAPYCTWH